MEYDFAGANPAQIQLETALLLAGLSARATAELFGKAESGVRRRWNRTTPSANALKREVEKQMTELIDAKIRKLVLQDSGFHPYSLEKFRAWCDANPLHDDR
jgi:hypothetical protein